MSNLGQLRNLLENQIDSETTTVSTDPTSTILNTYINNAIRRITRKDRPRELYSATVTTADITISTNTVSIPSGIFIPDLVYYEYSSGTVFQLNQKPIQELVIAESANRFFDSTNLGDPSYYDVRGTSLIFNKYFSRTATDAIKIYGMNFPTNLSTDSDETELPSDYDLLITYEAAILFYQKDDDLENQIKFQNLASGERAELRVFLRTNDSQIVELDPYTYTGNYQNAKNNADIFFGS